MACFAASTVAIQLIDLQLGLSSSSDDEENLIVRKRRTRKMFLINCIAARYAGNMRDEHMKLSGYFTNVIPKMTDWEFWRNFRMNRETLTVFVNFFRTTSKKKLFWWQCSN